MSDEQRRGDERPLMPNHIQNAYKDVVDNIMFSKRQQWVATNYVIAVYIAIFSISRYSQFHTEAIRPLLSVLVVVAAAYGVLLSRQFQSTLTTFRKRLHWIYKTYFKPCELEGLMFARRERGFWDDWLFLWAYWAVMIIGAILTTASIWMLPPNPLPG